MKKVFLTSILAIVSLLPIIAACGPSNKLPIVYITTNDGKDITSKETYKDATYWIQIPSGVSGYVGVGSKTAQQTLQVKGRGNWTWKGFDKKPYRMKLTEKTEILGMPANKNWALLAHADDDMSYMRNVMGFAASRLLEMPWTPRYEPVELVVNGNYLGLYMLTETVRIGKNRLNITEQADGETDPNKVTGGWLVEIDNYDDSEHITFYEGGDDECPIWVTMHSPENLSSVQKSYIQNIFNKMNEAIYVSDKSSKEWEKYVDMEALVNFYIVQELLNNQESFHGSCYIYKEVGNDTKLKFGPVWDFGNSYNCDNSIYIYEDPPFGQALIGEIAKFPRFQAAVRKRWNDVWWKSLKEIEAEMSAIDKKISKAVSSDCCRWPYYGSCNRGGYETRYVDAVHALENRYSWLQERWEGTGIDESDADNKNIIVYPNPVTDGVLYIASVDDDIESASLYALDGKLITEFGDVESGRLDLSVSSGMYLLKVFAGGKSSIVKVLVR